MAHPYHHAESSARKYGGDEINAAVNLAMDGGGGFASAIHHSPDTHHHTHRI